VSCVLNLDEFLSADHFEVQVFERRQKAVVARQTTIVRQGAPEVPQDASFLLTIEMKGPHGFYFYGSIAALVWLLCPELADVLSCGTVACSA